MLFPFSYKNVVLSPRTHYKYAKDMELPSPNICDGRIGEVEKESN